jgi:hypothetical protein
MIIKELQFILRLLFLGLCIDFLDDLDLIQVKNQPIAWL